MTISLVDSKTVSPNVSIQAGENYFNAILRAIDLVKTGVPAIFDFENGKSIVIGANSKVNAATVEKYVEHEHAANQYRYLHSIDGRSLAMLNTEYRIMARKVGAHMDIDNSLEEAAAKNPEVIVTWLKDYVNSDVYAAEGLEFGVIKSRITYNNNNPEVSRQVNDDKTPAAELLREIISSVGDFATFLPADIIERINTHQLTADYYKAAPETKRMLEGIAKFAEANGMEMKVPVELIVSDLDGPVETHHLTNEGKADLLETKLTVEVYKQPNSFAVVVECDKLKGEFQQLADKLGYSTVEQPNGRLYIESPLGTKENGMSTFTQALNDRALEISSIEESPEFTGLTASTDDLHEGQSRGNQHGATL